MRASHPNIAQVKTLNPQEEFVATAEGSLQTGSVVRGRSVEVSQPLQQEPVPQQQQSALHQQPVPQQQALHHQQQQPLLAAAGSLGALPLTRPAPAMCPPNLGRGQSPPAACRMPPWLPYGGLGDGAAAPRSPRSPRVDSWPFGGVANKLGMPMHQASTSHLR